jgi:MFS family permease
MDMCSIFTFLYLTNVYKTMGIKLGGLDDFSLTIIGALGGLANGSSRIVWGLLMDKYEFKTLYAIVLFVQMIVALSITTVVSNVVLYGVWVFIAYCCLGAHFVLFPTVILKVFGNRSGVQLASMVYFVMGISALLSVLIQFLYSSRQDVQIEKIMFYIASFFTGLSMIALTAFREVKILKISESE